MEASKDTQEATLNQLRGIGHAERTEDASKTRFEGEFITSDPRAANEIKVGSIYEFEGPVVIDDAESRETIRAYVYSGGPVGERFRFEFYDADRSGVGQ